ncbi:hypothetical protein DFR52_102364 [Hoeflea marina]|uniref:Uncharacterized protein n=1 Tax=Hoeflea marina TaxID=274592 RepID=A0A317PN68_9HYPH|nr:DUF6159 family protein [Hoeflea marina]PWW01701.1 hypothetical protein DFR52_102364 [Hoeflea marina]
MGARFSNSIRLVGACWRVLMLDKELLVFPLMSALALSSLSAIAVAPAVADGSIMARLEVFSRKVAEADDPRLLIMLFLIYFVAYFVMIFFNAALIACVRIRFAGGDPTVMDGLRAAGERLPQIFAWALLTSTVGFVLSQIENRSRGLMRFLVGLFGAGWAVATYFAVPVLVSERTGPIDAVRGSLLVIRHAWGESMISVVGLSVINSIGATAVAVIAIAGVFRFESSPPSAIALWIIAGASMVLLALVSSTLNTILRAALYAYAVDHNMPDDFDADLIRNAFSAERQS